MTTYIIKTALVLIGIIVLYLIARRQDEQQEMIEDMEEIVDGLIQNQSMITDIVTKELAFSQKVKREEKRIKKVAKPAKGAK